MTQEQAQRALERAQTAGWERSGNGRALLGILARRAALERKAKAAVKARRWELAGRLAQAARELDAQAFGR